MDGPLQIFTRPPLLLKIASSGKLDKLLQHRKEKKKKKIQAHCMDSTQMHGREKKNHLSLPCLESNDQERWIFVAGVTEIGSSLPFFISILLGF